jgi:protein-S-isoprenylcysteine O-methyltransferase Ste14
MTAGLFVAVHLFVLFYEEPTLENRFGASYLDYKKAVHRWLPKRPLRQAHSGLPNHA